MRLVTTFLLVSAMSAFAAGKTYPTAQAANPDAVVTATLLDTDAVRQQLGSDLGGYIIVLRVEMVPREGKTLKVSRDDFLLRSYKDGQRCQPYAPTQIAGRDALVVSPTAQGGVVTENSRGPTWGGMGGPPMRLPGQGINTGNVSSVEGASGTVQGSKQAGSADDPVLKALKEKILPEKETSEPVSGLLYFSLEGKHKTKDLQLEYETPSGKLRLRFK